VDPELELMARMMDLDWCLAYKCVDVDRFAKLWGVTAASVREEMDALTVVFGCVPVYDEGKRGWRYRDGTRPVYTRNTQAGCKRPLVRTE
jgi:hypothetical protein